MPKVTRKSSGFGKRISSGASREVTAALFAAGDAIATEASISITAGSVSGRNHVPSKPGEPPNADTGVLHRSIGVRSPKQLVVEVFANAPYAVPLEFGTSKMAARPFMRPAGQKMEGEAAALVRAAMAKIARGGKVTA